MALTKLTRDKFLFFLDVLKDPTYATSSWKVVDFSTIFALTMGEVEEDMDYICYENAVTEIKSNKPELPQEIAIYEGNPIYDFLIAEFYDMPVGAECKVPFLVCFGGTGKKSWRGLCTITSKVLDTVAGKITFSAKMGGTIDKGTYVLTDGVPAFTIATP